MDRQGVFCEEDGELIESSWFGDGGCNDEQWISAGLELGRVPVLRSRTSKCRGKEAKRGKEGERAHVSELSRNCR
jgi:hypothetical protein